MHYPRYPSTRVILEANHDACSTMVVPRLLSHDAYSWHTIRKKNNSDDRHRRHDGYVRRSIIPSTPRCIFCFVFIWHSVRRRHDVVFNKRSRQSKSNNRSKPQCLSHDGCPTMVVPRWLSHDAYSCYTIRKKNSDDRHRRHDGCPTMIPSSKPKNRIKMHKYNNPRIKLKCTSIITQE